MQTSRYLFKKIKYSSFEGATSNTFFFVDIHVFLSLYSCVFIIKFHCKPEYLLKWLGYTRKEGTREPLNHMNCSDLVMEFEKKRKCIVLGKFVDVKIRNSFSKLHKTN